MSERPCWWFIYYNERYGRLEYLPVGSKKSYSIKGTVVKNGSVFGYESDVQRKIKQLETEQQYRPRGKFYNSTVTATIGKNYGSKN